MVQEVSVGRCVRGKDAWLREQGIEECPRCGSWVYPAVGRTTLKGATDGGE